MFKTISIKEIIIEDRRREDFGDIEGLAESIRKYGLFHPPVVDDKKRLIAGERRIRACKTLGWTEIPTRFYSDLSDEERGEIELEENLKRKDLTPFEASKQLVKKARVVANLISSTVEEIKDSENKTGEQNLVLLNSDKTKSHGGKREDAGRKSSFQVPKQEIASSLGVGVGTLVRAEQHVKAVEDYPDIVHVPSQKDAIAVAKILGSVDKKKQAEIRSDLAKGEIGKVTKVTQEKEPYKKEPPKKKEPEVNWLELLNNISKHLTSITNNHGIAHLWRKWSKQGRKSYYQSICDLSERLNNLRLEIEEYFENER